MTTAVDAYNKITFILPNERQTHCLGVLFNPLPDVPILGFSNSAANKEMMSKIWTNGDTVI